MKLKIDGKDYELNTTKAIRDGYLVPSAITAFEVGDVFKWNSLIVIIIYQNGNYLLGQENVTTLYGDPIRTEAEMLAWLNAGNARFIKNVKFNLDELIAE